MKVFALFLLAFLAFPVTAESIKIGYIDTEKVVNSLTQYQQENTDIIKEFESKKQELLNLFNHIELVRENLSKIDKSLNESNFQIELDRKGPLDTMRILVETTKESSMNNIRSNIKDSFIKKVKDTIGVNVEVIVGAPNSVERSQGKARRVIDLRPKY